MKTALSIALLGDGLAAQSVPSFPTKNPLPPVTGDVKVAAEPMSKSATTQSESVRAPVVGPQKPAEPQVTAGFAAASAAMAQPDFLSLDTPRDGEHWARGRNYKAGFGTEGIEFFAAPADRNQLAPTATIRLQSATVGGLALELAKSAPQRQLGNVSWQRGSLVENVDCRPQGIEQTFTFARLPNRGELVLSMAVSSALAGEDLGNGVALAAGAIRYSEAVAIDANGNQVHAETHYANGLLSITVPATFLASATLPLVVDPWITSSTVITGSLDVSNADVAWDASSQSWMVAFESRFATNDTDMFAQRLSPTLAPVGSLITIDGSSMVWQLPAIANLNLHSRDLVVAQVSTDDVAPFWISGRVFDATGGNMTAQLDIDRAGVSGHAVGDKLRPDVGGDPALISPTYFTVVWERAFSAVDHDIHMKQVTFDGALRSATVTAISNSSANESFPSISKTDGPAATGNDVAFQKSAVVWQRSFSPTDEDVYGALLTWDGQFTLVGGSGIFAINSSTSNDTVPQVSTSTNESGVRNFLAVYERGGAVPHIAATAFASNGTIVTNANLSLLGNMVPTSWPQTRPSVDSDGVRFVVAYQNVHTGSGNDLDIRSMLVGLNQGSLYIRDEAWLASRTVPEFDCSIASVYSGSGVHDLHHAIVNDVTGASSFSIEAYAYQSFAAGAFAFRATSCGSLAIQPSGTVGLGQTVQFSLNTNYPISGFLVGFPSNTQTPACPGCILGVNGMSVMGSPYFFTIPANAAFVGLTLSAQGFTFAGGPCLGSVSVSDTVDFTLL